MKYATAKNTASTTSQVIAGIITLLISVSQAAAQSPTPVGVGRYQLVSGTIGEDGNQHPTIIKIDTITGQTWELIVAELPGKSPHGTIDGWAKLPDDIALDYKKLLDAATPKR